MTLYDQIHLAWQALTGHRLRSGLMLLAMAIGVAAVVFLTALGEGARRFVVGEFTALGTHLVMVLPGRNETTGGHPPLLGETPRDLTLEDALALERHPAIRRVAPLNVGSAPASHGRREREVTVIGTTAEFLAVRRLGLTQGRNLPAAAREAHPVALIGEGIRQELFAAGERALGGWLRLGDRRFRVIGVLRSEGYSIGLDIAELVLIPVASAQQLFDTSSLFRILVEARSREDVKGASDAVRRIIRERHEGEDDITVITQDAVVSTFDDILSVLTYMVGGVAAISLVVAGILVMNVMLVAVSQRTAEIGLLKALGASPAHIQRLFLTEAVLLSLMGAAIGLVVGYGAVVALRTLYPILSASPPPWALGAATGVALATGIGFGVLPARKAARLDPVQALARR